MEIKLHLFAAFGNYLPANSKGRTATLTVHEGMTIKDLLQQVGIPLTDVKLVSANGKQTAMEYRMQEGDTIGIYPPVAGG
jgi:sulfur carrier protein ThiS